MNGRYKNRSHANRGQDFESFLKYVNERYAADGTAIITKIPTEILPIRDRYGKICSAKVCSKSTVDFIGRVGSVPFAAEAKETKSDSIRFDAVQEHQAAFLDAYMGQNEAICIVLVSFNLESFYAVPWAFWDAAREAWKKAQRQNKRKAEQITITHEGQTWTTPGKSSVRESELMPEWKVEMGGQYGLDYLLRYRKRGTID